MARTTRKSAPVVAPMIDIGISARDREKIADSLAHVLADTYTLYLKTTRFTGTWRGRCSIRCT